MALCVKIAKKFKRINLREDGKKESKSKFSDSFKINWLVIGVIILAIEIYIAIFIKGGFIRHYIGDVLATAMLYAFGRAIFKVPSINLAIFVLSFRFL